MALRTLDHLDARGRRVLVRADLNVPVRDGRITDTTRIDRLAPTLRELSEKGARVIVCSHFERPKGKPNPAMSLRPMAEALATALGRPVAFAESCVGEAARAAVAGLRDGDVCLLENTRFHPGEEENESEFAAALAVHADAYVNDAFSAAHRAHASTEGVARHLPAYAGRLMQAELEALALALTHPERPVCAIVGGSKVSTKIDLLTNLSGAGAGAGDRGCDGQYLPGGAGGRGRPVLAGGQPARFGARHPGCGTERRLRSGAAGRCGHRHRVPPEPADARGGDRRRAG